MLFWGGGGKVPHSCSSRITMPSNLKVAGVGSFSRYGRHSRCLVVEINAASAYVQIAIVLYRRPESIVSSTDPSLYPLAPPQSTPSPKFRLSPAKRRAE